MKPGTVSTLGPHGFCRMAYAEWEGPEGSGTVVCVHGLTRTGRDFDFLARALTDRFRVVCPDVPGRGASDWLPAAEDYGYPVYLNALAALIARLGVEEVSWVGTSMGGLLGMMLAAQPGTPIRRLVLNDVGPWIPKAAVERIAAYVGSDPRFEDLPALEAHLREVHRPFGPLTDEQWRHLAEHSARRLPDGTLRLHYDPAIAAGFRAAPAQDVDLWGVWAGVRCPVLVLRGADSDLLLPETVAEMRGKGPPVDVVEFPGIGHAPALAAADQIDVIRAWLTREG